MRSLQSILEAVQRSRFTLDLALAVASLAAALLFSLCVYRLYFHPYAKYPGPFLAKLTSWYSVYHVYIGDLHTHIWECHQKYGDLVRFGPNRLLVNTSQGWRGIYGSGKNVAKQKGYRKVSLVPGVDPTFGTIDDKAHGKLRRLLNYGLSNGSLRSNDEEISALARLFASRLGEKNDRFNTKLEPTSDGWSAPKNMAEWSNLFTFDVMSQLVFGTSYDLLTNAEDHWIIDGVLGQMRRISFLTTMPELDDMGFHRILFPDARRRAYKFSMKSREIMEARSKRDEEEKGNDDSAKERAPRKDIFSRLLTAKDPETGEGLSQTQLWAESNLLIIAGSDTSSTGIAALFFYLSRHQAAYNTVAQEVRSTLTSDEDVCQGPKLQSCTYLRACVQEGLRLAPAGSGAMWREARQGGLHIDDTDIYIPEGCEVGTGIYSLNHSEVNFPNPFEFRPERWIASEAGEEAVRLARLGFATFSHGPRNCVGKGLAEFELALALAAVLRKFDFRLSETDLGKVGEGKGKVGEGKGPYSGQYDLFWAFTSLKDGPYIQFKQIGQVD